MKKLGFGAMRLPLLDDNTENIDLDITKEMIDYYMSHGYNYFDTAYVYHKKESENVLRKLLTNRYPRESYVLTTKLPIFNIEKEEEMEEIFNEQLKKCGVDYFDYYLLHNTSTKHEKKFTEIDSFKFVRQKKKEGKIKHIGISCHDSPEFLENILVEHPEIEVVQLQINYLDWNDKVINARECHKIATKYDKPVIIMEGLKGGSLVNLPDNASELLKSYDEKISPVEWCFRFNYSLDNILVVLSGMNSLSDVKENIRIYEDFKALTSEEYKLLENVAEEIRKNKTINCTSCNYCVSHCPVHIRIPKFFELYNSQQLLHKNHALGMYYRNLVSIDDISASSCIKCNSCIDYCPQQINIPGMLEVVAERFE